MLASRTVHALDRKATGIRRTGPWIEPELSFLDAEMGLWSRTVPAAMPRRFAMIGSQPSAQALNADSVTLIALVPWL